MIRVHVETAGRLSEQLRTRDPVEAEVHYLRLVVRRPAASAAVVVTTSDPDVILPARYELALGWPLGVPRETSPERQRRQWTRGPPTPEMIRAVGVLAELSGAEASRLVGVSDGRVWRRWISGDRAMPIAAYWWLLVCTGLHPEFLGRADRLT